MTTKSFIYLTILTTSLSSLCIAFAYILDWTNLKLLLSRKSRIRVTNKVLSKTQQKLLDIISGKLESNEIISNIFSTSLLSAVDSSFLTTLSYLSNDSQENYINFAAVQALENNSIIRNLVTVKSVRKHDYVEELFNQNALVYSDFTVRLKNLDNENKVKIPLKSLTFSIKPEYKLSTIDQLKLCGVEVGETYSSFENDIFIAMLKSSVNTMYVEDVEDLASLYRFCYNLIIKGSKSLHLILPKSYDSVFKILKDEVLQEFSSVNLTASFLPDLSLFKLGVTSLMIDRDPNIKLVCFQEGNLGCSVIEMQNNGIYVQSSVTVGFAISGLKEVYICKYEKDKKETKIEDMII